MRIVRTLALIAALVPSLPASAFAAEAVASGNGGTLSLGSNWGPYETYRGVSFRWVDNDAEIILRGAPGELHVSIACEGGPSLGQSTFPLRVLDRSHRQVDHVVCAGAGRPAQMLLPGGSGDTRYLLHADGGGRPVRGERRILNFRVFSIDDGRGTAATGDVADRRSGVRLGDGWYPVERYNGQTFRWMKGDGHVVVNAGRAARGALRLLLEVGPSVGARSAQISVRDKSGHVLLRTAASGRAVVTVPVQLQPGDNEFAISVASANKPVPHDNRLLNLRLFSATAQR